MNLKPYPCEPLSKTAIAAAAAREAALAARRTNARLRWCAGEPLPAIAKAIGVSIKSVLLWTLDLRKVSGAWKPSPVWSPDSRRSLAAECIVTRALAARPALQSCWSAL